MYCLHCGDCCLRMSPLSAPNPCIHLIQKNTFYFCDNYNNRPVECIDHKFDANYCPIGLSKLNIKTADQIRQRIDSGYALIRYKNLELSEALHELYKCEYSK